MPFVSKVADVSVAAKDALTEAQARVARAALATAKRHGVGVNTAPGFVQRVTGLTAAQVAKLTEPQPRTVTVTIVADVADYTPPTGDETQAAYALSQLGLSTTGGVVKSLTVTATKPAGATKKAPAKAPAKVAAKKTAKK